MEILVLVSGVYVLYLVSFGIGHTLEQVKKKWNSEIKTAIASCLIWVPILIVASALIKL